MKSATSMISVVLETRREDEGFKDFLKLVLNRPLRVLEN